MKIVSFLEHVQLWSEFMMLPVHLIGSVFNIHIVQTCDVAKVFPFQLKTAELPA